MRATLNGQRAVAVPRRVVVPVVRVRNALLRVVAQVTAAVRAEQRAVSVHRPGHHAVAGPLERPVRVHVRAVAERADASRAGRNGGSPKGRPPIVACDVKLVEHAQRQLSAFVWKHYFAGHKRRFHQKSTICHSAR